MIIEKIIEEQIKILDIKKREKPIEELKYFKREKIGLVKNLKNRKIGIIGEIKRASPSAGIINNNIDVCEIAKEYEKLGVAGISVLTCSPYFLGSIDDLKKAREIVSLPILMKDFVFDEYQIYEGNFYGADVVLLILRVIDDKNFKNLLKISEDLDFEIIIEVHNENELKRAFSLVDNWKNKIIGINNRDLDTLEVDLNTTLNLIKFIDKDKIPVISESGIKEKKDILKLKEIGVNNFLIGESILKSDKIEKKLKELMEGGD